MAWKVPATLKRAMLCPSASTTLPVPGATSFVSATFTRLDMVFPPFSHIGIPSNRRSTSASSYESPRERDSEASFAKPAGPDPLISSGKWPEPPHYRDGGDNGQGQNRGGQHGSKHVPEAGCLWQHGGDSKREGRQGGVHPCQQAAQRQEGQQEPHREGWFKLVFPCCFCAPAQT